MGLDEFPFVVIAPIAPTRGWSDHFEKLDALLDAFLPSARCDPEKLHVFGQSMGGNGALEYAIKNPTKFASIAAACGYINRSSPASESSLSKLSSISSIPTWLFHASNDAIVDVEHTDEIHKYLLNLSSSSSSDGNNDERLKYTRYATAPGLPGMGEKGAGHACYEIAFEDVELYRWILRQSL